MPTQSYRQLTVPGSLLLAGEYAVLCSGGLGLGLALEPRVRVYWCASSTFRVHCTYGNQRLEWFPQGDISHSLLEAIWQTLKIKPPFYALTLDSRLMNRPDGRKAGLGSSAAVAVGGYCGLDVSHYGTSAPATRCVSSRSKPPIDLLRGGSVVAMMYPVRLLVDWGYLPAGHGPHGSPWMSPVLQISVWFMPPSRSLPVKRSAIGSPGVRDMKQPGK